MDNKKCSIVIPTYNRADLLKTILSQLSNQDSVDLIGEILICDSLSHDSTSEVIENAKTLFSDTNILHLNTENNISKKRNIGISKASYDYLIFFDDDCEPEKDCIENHVNALKQSKMTIFSGIVKFPDDQVLEDNYIRYRNSRHRFYDNFLITDSISYKEIVTMNLSISREDLIKNDLFFDETFLSYGMEDNEFGFRASQKGFQLHVCQASIIHHDRHDLNTFKKKIYSTARDGTGRFLEKYPEAVWNFYYSKYFEPDYPYHSLIDKIIAVIFRSLLFNSVSNILTKILIATKNNNLFYSKYPYKYVLACEYNRGVKERHLRYKNDEEIKKGFFD